MGVYSHVRDFSRVLTLRTFRLVGPPAPSQALTSPVAPNGHRRAFRTRRRAPCRDSFRAAWLPPRPEPLPRMPFKATSSRFRTPSTGSIPASRPETVTRMNNWRRTSKQPGHPSYDRQLPGPSRLVGRHSSLLPVVTSGTSQRRRPSGRRHLLPISATKPSCQNRAPCETASFRDGFRLAPVRPPFSGPALPPARYARALEQHRRRRRRLAAFGGVAGPGWCRGLGVPRAPAAIIRPCFPAMGPPLLCQSRA